MPTNYTSNYNLNQWKPEDKVLRTDFNADNAKLDEALSGLAEADRAEAGARAAGDASLSAVLADHAAELTKRGNCQIYTTSYVGTGKYGSENPNTLTFPGKPLLIAIMSTEDASFYIMIQGCRRNGYLGGASYSISVTWSGNSVSWYGDNVHGHLSQKGITYQVVAFMAMD